MSLDTHDHRHQTLLPPPTTIDSSSATKVRITQQMSIYAALMTGEGRVGLECRYGGGEEAMRKTRKNGRENKSTTYLTPSASPAACTSANLHFTPAKYPLARAARARSYGRLGKTRKHESSKQGDYGKVDSVMMLVDKNNDDGAWVEYSRESSWEQASERAEWYHGVAGRCHGWIRWCNVVDADCSVHSTTFVVTFGGRAGINKNVVNNPRGCGCETAWEDPGKADQAFDVVRMLCFKYIHSDFEARIVLNHLKVRYLSHVLRDTVPLMRRVCEVQSNGQHTHGVEFTSTCKLRAVFAITTASSRPHLCHTTPQPLPLLVKSSGVLEQESSMVSRLRCVPALPSLCRNLLTTPAISTLLLHPAATADTPALNAPVVATPSTSTSAVCDDALLCPTSHPSRSQHLGSPSPIPNPATSHRPSLSAATPSTLYNTVDVDGRTQEGSEQEAREEMSGEVNARDWRVYLKAGEGLLSRSFAVTKLSKPMLVTRLSALGYPTPQFIYINLYKIMSISGQKTWKPKQTSGGNITSHEGR
ncbi:hypothetical protein R3P38DRAFT_2766573 [Favolaschia claudopus]|uniref:Uncharacterized protein n=1 Tax=Favolaschia claudopus TaxID=2862362 RepID=A0AAW0D4T0_9AGAR